jgi:hypothetical protein
MESRQGMALLVTGQFDARGFEKAVQYNETVQASHMSRSTLPL